MPPQAGRDAPLTRAQARVMATLDRWVQREGLAPTLGELAHDLNVSAVTVLHHLRNLERLGMVRRKPRSARTVRLSARGREYLGVRPGQRASRTTLDTPEEGG